VKNQFFLQAFLKFLAKKKVIFFVLGAKVEKNKKLEKVPFLSISHKAWGRLL
jgi:hypothetical protein